MLDKFYRKNKGFGERFLLTRAFPNEIGARGIGGSGSGQFQGTCGYSGVGMTDGNLMRSVVI